MEGGKKNVRFKRKAGHILEIVRDIGQGYY